MRFWIDELQSTKNGDWKTFFTHIENFVKWTNSTSRIFGKSRRMMFSKNVQYKE